MQFPTFPHLCLPPGRTTNRARQRLLLGAGPNVGELMLLCEENYRRLLLLMPTLPRLTGNLVSRRTGQTDLLLEVVAQAPYTTTLRLTHLFTAASDPHAPEPPPVPPGSVPSSAAAPDTGALTHPIEAAAGSAMPAREPPTEPNALLRAYHDAAQVEVLDLRQTVLPLYRHYGAPALEAKWRANLFLSKWLAYCLREGHVFSASGQGLDSSQRRELLPTF